jgi:hypothetical protein
MRFYENFKVYSRFHRTDYWYFNFSGTPSISRPLLLFLRPICVMCRNSVLRNTCSTATKAPAGLGMQDHIFDSIRNFGYSWTYPDIYKSRSICPIFSLSLDLRG